MRPDLCRLDTRPRHRDDRGASFVEYGGVVLLVGAISAAVFAVGAPERTAAMYRFALCGVESKGASDQCSEGAGSPESGPKTPQSSGTGPDSPGSPDYADLSPDDGGTYFSVASYPSKGSEQGSGEEEGDSEDAPEFTPGEIGDPGSVPEGETPELPPFTDSGADSGEYGSKDPPEPWEVFEQQRLAYYISKYTMAAHGGALAGAPHAKEYLLHFLGNTGEPVDVPVDSMLDEVPSFQTAVDIQRRRLAQEAVARAEEMGIEETTTFPFSTPWETHATNSGESFDWYYSLGSWYYGQTGTITVQPPSDGSDVYTYRIESEVHVQKEYDWDPKKKVGPLGAFDQEELAELHRYGYAQEFDMEGSTSYTHDGAYTP